MTTIRKLHDHRSEPMTAEGFTDTVTRIVSRDILTDAQKVMYAMIIDEFTSTTQALLDQGGRIIERPQPGYVGNPLQIDGVGLFMDARNRIHLVPLFRGRVFNVKTLRYEGGEFVVRSGGYKQSVYLNMTSGRYSLEDAVSGNDLMIRRLKTPHFLAIAVFE